MNKLKGKLKEEYMELINETGNEFFLDKAQEIK